MHHSMGGAAAENMLQAAYLTIGKLAPDYENVELSVGGSTVAAAVVEATGNPKTRFAILVLCWLWAWLFTIACEGCFFKSACNMWAVQCTAGSSGSILCQDICMNTYSCRGS